LGNNKSTVSGPYLFLIGAVSAFLAVFFFWLSQFLADQLKSLLLSFLFLVIIILIGITADIIGTAVAAAREAPFHARAAKKVPGAQQGVFLIRHADRVANICNDVIGDIAGTVSGALGISLAVQVLVYWRTMHQSLLNMLVTALIAAVTVMGKATGKRLAITRANEVIFLVGRIIAGWEGLTGISLTGRARRQGNR